MKNLIKRVLIIVLMLCSSVQVFATHNRAGEITFTRLSGFTYHVKVVTYTVASSQADRNQIQLTWGDGITDTLDRSNGVSVGGFPQGEIIAPDVKMNTYEGTHTYPGPGQFLIGFEDANRNSNVVNIPASVNVPFYVQSMITIDPFLGANSSPVLLNPPLDDACVGKLFVHNPAAWDVDGDSLAYHLIACAGEGGAEISGYSIPPNVSVNEFTGDLIWDTPTFIGEYNYAIRIEEWRGGQMIGYIIRDLQVSVEDCANNPPVIVAPLEICIEAGDTVLFEVSATDVDAGDFVTLNATGGVFEVESSPAVFDEDVGSQFAISEFEWETNCSHVRSQPYQVLFKASDNSWPINLVGMQTVNITVVAPAPENIQAVPIGNSINLSWDESFCTEAIGYKIYRGSYINFNPDDCELGVPSYTGYVLIGTVDSLTNTAFIDNNDGNGLSHGMEYCYMVVACFPDGAESYASTEICAELNRDMPIITNISIQVTSPNIGEVFVAWSKPTELDTVSLPSPYRYDLFRSISGGVSELVYSTSNLNDTTFVDAGLSTLTDDFRYHIDFYNDSQPSTFFIGTSQSANSIFLNIDETDQSLTLSWTDVTPWTNNLFKVYQETPTSSQNFVLIDSTTSTTITIDSLENEITYCYKVESVGSYSAPGIINPILNLSQESCGTPLDTIPPCAPLVIVEDYCNDYYNQISWEIDSVCNSDVVEYVLYHRPTLTDSFSILLSVPVEASYEFLHDNLTSIAGCYFVAGIDSFGNETPILEGVCVDNCPEYELPNIFTPNADGFNDLFGPFPYKYIDHVDIRIYNRWGLQLFEYSGNPDIGWNGFNSINGEPAPSGVYYYVCDVYEIRLTGLEKRTINSFFHLLEINNQNGNLGN